MTQVRAKVRVKIRRTSGHSLRKKIWVRGHVDLSSLLQGWRMRVDPRSQYKDASNNSSKQRPGRMNQGPVKPMVVIVFHHGPETVGTSLYPSLCPRQTRHTETSAIACTPSSVSSGKGTRPMRRF